MRTLLSRVSHTILRGTGARCRALSRRGVPWKSDQSFQRSHVRAVSSLPEQPVTLIVGGGPMGFSAAYHLAQQRNDDGRGIIVVERDPTYSKASATLSAGGIRQQFSLKENVKMSLYGIDFLRKAAENLSSEANRDVDVQLQELGYLFLASTPHGKQQMLENHQEQCDAGCDNMRILDQEQLQTSFPWLNSSDILLGSYGVSGEGWFDPWALVQGLKHKSIEMGVTFVSGIPIHSTRDPQTGRVESVHVQSTTAKRKTNQETNVAKIAVNQVVNAAGAHCQAAMNVLAGDQGLQYAIPVEPRKRCIFFFHCPSAASLTAPLTVCPITGVYFRSEGSGTSGNFLCGVSPSPEIDRAIGSDVDLDFVDDHLFDDVIWPALYNRVPDHFGEIKVKSSWAGLYEYNTLDQNCILDFHPEMENVLMVNGFSGHGLQHSPAAGRAAAELLDFGEFQTLDLSVFNFDRVIKGDPLLEQGIV